MERVKAGLGLLGILVAIVGIRLDSRAVIWVAIGVLGTSLLLRVILGWRARRAPEHTAGEGPEAS